MGISVPQLTYNQFPAEGLEGMAADGSNGNPTVDTMLADVALECARGVVTGGASTLTDPDRCKLPTQATDISAHFKGISMYVAAKMPIAGLPRFAIKDAVPVMRKGRMYILPEGDMVDDGPVYVVNASGAGTPGRFRGDANAGAATIVPNGSAICRRGATVASGKLAVIEINLP